MKPEDLYAEFQKDHLPNLFKYVVPIAHENTDNRRESIGSGVLVNLNGRHYVATAAHCIKLNPRVLHDVFYMLAGRLHDDKPVKIVDRGWHATLDVGFLQIDEPMSKELDESHLCVETVKEGTVHVIGHPRCEANVDPAKGPIEVKKCVFGSSVLEQSAAAMRLAYPVDGVRFAKGQWWTEPFPETPHGFSGGGCFGVSYTTGPVVSYQYKLLAIQVSWHSGERWVEAVPIKQWLSLVSELAMRN
jgi:hypothetical protein